MFYYYTKGFIFVQNSGTRYRVERDRANKLLKNQASISQALPNPLQPVAVLPEATKAESSKKEHSTKGYIIPARRQKETQTSEPTPAPVVSKPKEYSLGDRKSKTFISKK